MNPEDKPAQQPINQPSVSGPPPQPVPQATMPAQGLQPKQPVTSQPVQPAPAQSSQAVEQAPLIQTAQDGTTRSNFSSNPFKAVGKGLGTLLNTNPLSGMLINFAFLLLLIPFIVVIPFMFIIQSGIVNMLIGIGVFVAVVLLIIRISAAGYYLYIQSGRGEETTVRKSIGKGASGSLTSFVIAGILASIAVLFGFLLFVIPGLILLARFSLFPFAIFEEGLGPIAGLKRSFQLTKKHTFEMFGVLVTGSILSGNSLIFPVVSIAGQANRYFELKDHEEKNLATGKVHILNYIITLLGILLVVLNIVVAALSASSTSNTNNGTLNGTLYDDDYFDSLNSEFNTNFDFEGNFELNTLEN